MNMLLEVHHAILRQRGTTAQTFQTNPRLPGRWRSGSIAGVRLRWRRQLSAGRSTSFHQVGVAEELLDPTQ